MFKDNRILGPEEGDFNEFYQYMGMTAILVIPFDMYNSLLHCIGDWTKKLALIGWAVSE